MTNHNSPQPTEQPEVLYRWVDGDYERLYDLLRETKERVVCKVAYPWVEGDSVTDIARIHPTTLEIQARGIGYNSPRDVNDKDSFVRMCEESCVEWLEPLPSQLGESVDALELENYHICKGVEIRSYNSLVCSMCRGVEAINFYTTKDEVEKMKLLLPSSHSSPLTGKELFDAWEDVMRIIATSWIEKKKSIGEVVGELANEYSITKIKQP